MTYILDLIEYNSEIPYRVVFALLSAGFAFLWLSLFIWVWTDSKIYFKSFFVRFFFSAATLLLGFIGLLVYLLFRLSRTADADYPSQSDLELLSLGLVSCHGCNSHCHIDDQFCSKCGYRLMKRCKGCSNYVRINDVFCSECGLTLKKISKNQTQKELVEKKIAIKIY